MGIIKFLNGWKRVRNPPRWILRGLHNRYNLDGGNVIYSFNVKGKTFRYKVDVRNWKANDHIKVWRKLRRR